MSYSKREISDYLETMPVIPAVNNIESLEDCLKSECKAIFILFGDICNIASIVSRAKKAKKIALVHIDLIDGLSSKEISVKFIKEYTKADGIISTKSQMIKCAKELGMITVQRFFILDSLALKNVTKQLNDVTADVIEILPAISHKIIKNFSSKCRHPLIIGGLISDKEDVIQMLSAGASGVSTTKKELWNI